jgi:hypothetical protein
MMRIRAEDQELGWSICLFNCFLLAGCIVWGRSSGSCGVLNGAFIAVFQTVLERLISVEVHWLNF